MTRLRLALICLCALTTSAWAGNASPEAAATVVLYNKNDASSLALARYYAGKRGIEADSLVGLDCSSDEEISRDAYLVHIEAPVRAAFDKHGWWKIRRGNDGRRLVTDAAKRFVAIMRGVPLKIASDAKTPPTSIYKELDPGSPLQSLVPHNEASVDSELAALFAQLDETPSVIANPYYRRFTPALSLPPAITPLFVCRLDGPSDLIVRRMIDDSLATEKTGLWGWAYLDARGITDPAYVEGDKWLTNAARLMRRQGIPVISDYAPETWRDGFPVTDAAVYYGWYDGDVSGPFVQPGFRFVPGAVAVHLHSYSARTLRDPKVSWAAPLLADGATVTMGNVYEPYLALTVNFDVLQDRLMNGLTLAEAAYAATRGISWMNVVLGDPLYRPYASWTSLEPDTGAPNIWQRYRKIVLDAGGDPLAAADALRKLAADTKNSMPLEALAQAQAAVGDIDTAPDTLAAAAKLEEKSAIRFRLALERIEFLRRAGRADAAVRAVSDAIGDFPGDSEQLTLGQLARILKPQPSVTP
jgi:uncharacterized protein (TIGR03790 family)